MSYKYWHRINVSQVMFPSCSLAILWGVRPQMCSQSTTMVLTGRSVHLHVTICNWQQPAKTQYWCGFKFFHVISMLQKNCAIKEHFIRVMQKGIGRSCLPENFKLLTLTVLEIWSLMCSQNSHL